MRKDIGGVSLMETLLVIGITLAMGAGVFAIYARQSAVARRVRYVEHMKEIDERTGRIFYGRNISTRDEAERALEQAGVNMIDPWNGKLNIEMDGECYAILSREMPFADCTYLRLQAPSPCAPVKINDLRGGDCKAGRNKFAVYFSRQMRHIHKPN